MRRAAVRVALLLPLVGAVPTEEASSATRPNYLWYRTTVVGSFRQTVDGSIFGDSIYDQSQVVGVLTSDTANIVSRSRDGLSVPGVVNLHGRVTDYDRSKSFNYRFSNTGEPCIENTVVSYTAPPVGPVQDYLSGILDGIVTKLKFAIAGRGSTSTHRTTTYACRGSPSSTITDPTSVPPLGSPPREFFDYDFSPVGRIRFGRFFTVEKIFVLFKPLSELYIGGVGTWEQRWQFTIMFFPCPNQSC